MGDLQQRAQADSEESTAILTPISNSPSTPAPRDIRGIKRKFEDEPPELRLPNPLIPPPAQSQAPLMELPQISFVFGALQNIYHKFGVFTGLIRESPSPPPISEPEANSESATIEQVSTAEEPVSRNENVSPTPPDSPIQTRDAETQAGPKGVEMEPPQKSKQDDPKLREQFGYMLLQRTLEKRDAIGKSSAFYPRDNGFQNRRHRQNRTRVSQSAGSPLAKAFASPIVTPQPQRNVRRKYNKGQDIKTPNPKIESARKAAKKDEEFLQAFFASLEENNASLNQYIGALVGTNCEFKSFETVIKEREKREVEIQRLKELSKKSKEPIVKPLSRATLAQVNQTLADPNETRPIIEKFRITMHTRDVQTLRERTWLNDEVVNFYLNMVCERANAAAGGKVKVFAFNSFFYKKLSEEGYKSIARWSKRFKIDGDNLLKLDYLIIPVHLTYHWTLGVINFTKKRIEYFDSLGGRGTAFYKHMRNYLSNETRNKINLDEWVDYSMKGAPMQENSYDCGVFLCKTAEVVCRGLDPIFTQNDISLLRRRMVAEIMKGELGVD